MGDEKLWLDALARDDGEAAARLAARLGSGEGLVVLCRIPGGLGNERVSVASAWGLGPLAALSGAGRCLEALARGGKAGAMEGPDPARGALQAAALAGREDMVAMLLESGLGLNPDLDGALPAALTICASKGMLGAARALLAAGADPGRRHESGDTPLKAACLAGSAGVAELLLDWGAGPDDPGLGQNGPMQMAAKGRSLECARLLARRGANLELCGANGQTPLKAAVSARWAQGIRLFLELGCDPDSAGQGLNTPMTLALETGYAQGAMILEQGGADPRKARPDGKSPVQMGWAGLGGGCAG